MNQHSTEVCVDLQTNKRVVYSVVYVSVPNDGLILNCNMDRDHQMAAQMSASSG